MCVSLWQVSASEWTVPGDGGRWDPPGLQTQTAAARAYHCHPSSQHWLLCGEECERGGLSVSVVNVCAMKATTKYEVQRPNLPPYNVPGLQITPRQVY